MGPVAIMWDMENCPVPGEINAEDVAGNLRTALQVHPAVGGSVIMFAAYGDFSHFPTKLREGCQRTGVNLIDVPNGKKDASDKAILVDMFLFALDNPPPCTIFLISGDVDFASALHKLGRRGYTIVLAIPSRGVSSALISAGRYVWDWPSVARGEGLVPAKAFQANKSLCAGNEINGCFAPQRAGWIATDDSGQPKHEFALPDFSQRNILKNKGYSAFQSQDNDRLVNAATQLRSFEKSLTDEHQELNAGGELTNPGVSFQTSRVKPKRLGSLRRQLVELISLHGGKLRVALVREQYRKIFRSPLNLAQYKSSKLSSLIRMMPETFLLTGKPKKRTVHLIKAGMQSPSKSKGTFISFPADQKDVDRDKREKEVAGVDI